MSPRQRATNAPPDPSAPLDSESYKDALVAPTTPYPRPKRKNAMRMGVVDRRGKVVRRSQLWRSYGRMGFPPEVTSTPRKDPREVIYVGHLPAHFGHFILEGLSRLWFAAEHPELPIVWAGRAGEPTSYSRWQRQILDVLEIRNEAVFVADDTRFARVHVPQAGYRIKDYFSAQLARFLAVYPARQREPGRKLWLSRANVPSRHGSVYATRLDEQLAEHGWGIVHPERLPISKQLELLATASRVAAEEGSALHLLLLLSDVRGLRVDILSRRPDRSVEEQNANYETIAATRGLEQRRHVIPEERVVSASAGHVTKAATSLAGHLEALGIAREDDGTTVARPAVRVVTAIADGARAYLELGTGPDGLDEGLDTPLRDIVRPLFRSDPRRSVATGRHLFEMPFDEFFEYHVRPEQRYDLVVLDGFRSASDLRRCYRAASSHAHASTRWVICGPADVVESFGGSITAPSRMETTGEGPCLVVDGSAASTTS